MEQIKLDTPLTTASKIEIDEVENPELAIAVNALRDYALNKVLFYDVEIRETFRSSKRADFDNEVKRAINDAVTGFSRGELTSELAEKEDFSVLYAEMFTDHEFAENLYSEISDILYAEHTRIAKARETAHKMNTIAITVGNQSGTNDTFDVTSVGFNTEKRYTVAEFNQALKKANEIWKEGWDGLSYPHDIAIVTVENLHTEPCTYRINLADVDYGSIQDIVRLSPTPMHASISTDEALEKLNKAEHIPPQQDISHKTNNSAELSAAEKSANGQKRSIIMSNNTKLSVSSMTILGEDSSAKAYATVTINDEFAIRNVKVFEGKNGPFVSMPSRKIGGEYQDVVFPITKEAREQFNAAVIDRYNEMQKSGEEHFMSENTPPEKAISTITASVHLSEGGSNVKATGQIVIDDSFVVSGVCVIAGNGNLFASMPSYTNDIDERKDFAFPITKECYEKVQGAVLNDFNYIQSYHEMGGKENLTTAYDLHPKFADRLSAELNKNGITNIVKVKDGTANISVKISDKEKFTEIRKELAQSLKQAKQEREGGKKSLSEQISKAKEQQSEKTAEQPKQPQPHRKPNQAEL